MEASSVMYSNRQWDGALQAFQMGQMSMTYTSSPSYNHQPIVIINELQSELDLSSVIDDLIWNKEFSQTSSLFVVVPTEDGQDSEESLCTDKRSRFSTKNTWQYADTRQQYLPHIKTASVSKECLKISAKGRRFFWEGVPTAEVPTINKETMATDFCERWALRRSIHNKTAGSVDGTDTTVDRPCSCDHYKYGQDPTHRTKQIEVSCHNQGVASHLLRKVISADLSEISLCPRISCTTCSLCGSPEINNHPHGSTTSIPKISINHSWSTMSIIQDATPNILSPVYSDTLPPRLHIFTITDKPCNCSREKLNKFDQPALENFIYLKNVKCGRSSDARTYSNQNLLHLKSVISKTTSPIRIFNVSRANSFNAKRGVITLTGTSRDYSTRPCVIFEPEVTTSGRVITLTGDPDCPAGPSGLRTDSTTSKCEASSPALESTLSICTSTVMLTGSECPPVIPQPCSPHPGPPLKLTSAPCSNTCTVRPCKAVCADKDYINSCTSPVEIPSCTPCGDHKVKSMLRFTKFTADAISRMMRPHDYRKFTTKKFVKPIPSLRNVCRSPKCRSLKCPTKRKDRAKGKCGVANCKSTSSMSKRSSSSKHSSKCFLINKGSGINVVQREASRSKHSLCKPFSKIKGIMRSSSILKVSGLMKKEKKEEKEGKEGRSVKSKGSTSSCQPSQKELQNAMKAAVGQCSTCKAIEKKANKKIKQPKSKKCPCSSSSLLSKKPTCTDCACQKSSKCSIHSKACTKDLPKPAVNANKVMLTLGHTGPPCAPRRMVTLAVQAGHSCCKSITPPVTTQNWRVQPVRVRVRDRPKKSCFGIPGLSRETVQMEIVGPLGGFAASGLDGTYTQASVRRTRYNVGINTTSGWKSPSKGSNKSKKSKKKKNDCACHDLSYVAPGPEIPIISPATFEAAREAYDIQRKRDLLTKSNLAQTTSGFKVRANKLPPEPEWTVEDSIRYFAMTNPQMVRDIISAKGSRHKIGPKKKNCVCDKLSGPKVECECIGEGKSEEELGAFKGLKFRMDGKGSGSKGLAGVCCFDVILPEPGIFKT